MIIKEVAASLYPWDLADEGIDSCGSTLTERAAVNSIYLVGIMHHEKRPLTSLFYTHNPKRKWYAPENSRIYYPMDAKNFADTPLKPMYSEREFLKGKDWLKVLTDWGRKHGLKTGAEISHTFYDTEIAKKDHPDVLQKDINGRILDGFFCQNNEKVRAYMRAIFFDTVRNHDIDFIQTCMMLFSNGTPVTAPWFFDTWMKTSDPANRLAALLGVARGGCFCDNCKKKAAAMGYDWKEIVKDMTVLEQLANATSYRNQDLSMDNALLMGSNLMESGLMLEYPGLFQFLQFRARTITEAFKGIYEGVKAANPKVDFRYNNYLRYPELAGLEFKLVAPYLDSVRDSDYTEQLRAPDDFVYKRNTLNKIRRGIGFDKALIAALAVRPNATPELLMRSLAILAELGLDGISLGHYDGSHMEHLDAIKQGMKQANIVLA